MILGKKELSSNYDFVLIFKVLLYGQDHEPEKLDMDSI